MPRKPEVNVLIKARDLASQVFGRFQRTVRSVTRTVKNVARGLTTFGVAAGAAVEALRRLQSQGASVVAVKRAFAKVTDDETGALQKLRDAARGTISDFDLMRLSNQAVALGAVDSAEGFATMARQARLLGRAQGIDATEALEKYTVGLARQSKLRLDDLGITLEQAEANERYAAKVGKSASALTEAEKATAFRNEAMRKAEELVGELTTGELGAVAAGDKLATTVDNIRSNLVELIALSPQVSSFLEGLALFLEELSGTDVGLKAVEEGLARISDPRVLRVRSGSVFAELSEATTELNQLRDDFADRGLGRLSDEEMAGRSGAFRAQLEQVRMLEAELDLVDERLRQVLSGRPGEDEVPAEPVGVAGPSIDGTEANLRGLLDALRDTQGALDEARLDQALASPGEEAEKSKQKVNDLIERLEHLQRLASPFGGQMGLAARFDPTPLLSQPDLEGRTGGFVTDFRPQVEPLEGVPESITKGTDALDEGAKKWEGTAQVAAASFFSMAEAAARGSDQVASSVVSMISNILQSIPGVGGFAGAIIGGVGGLVSAALSRRNDPVPVRLQDVDDRAARKLNQADQRPVRIVTIVEQEGVEIERIERELFARQDRDEVVRFSSGSPLVR